MDCVVCKTQNPEGAKYCGTCGVRLDPHFGPLNEVLEASVRREVDSALHRYLKDQKASETDITEHVAKRLIGWVKIVAILLVPLAALAGIFGFKTCGTRKPPTREMGGVITIWVTFSRRRIGALTTKRPANISKKPPMPAILMVCAPWPICTKRAVISLRITKRQPTLATLRPCKRLAAYPRNERNDLQPMWSIPPKDPLPDRLRISPRFAR